MSGKAEEEPAASEEGLFVYGTLLVRDVVQAVLGRVPSAIPATLLDHKARRVNDAQYPAVLPCAGERVEGAVLTDLSLSEMGHLDAYEGLDDEEVQEPEGTGWGYKKVRVRVLVDKSGGVLRAGFGSAVIPEREAEDGREGMTVSAYLWRGARDGVGDGWTVGQYLRNRGWRADEGES